MKSKSLKGLQVRAAVGICWLILVALSPGVANAGHGRQSISLSGDGWYMWQDKAAEWKNDKLYLPEEISELSQLPVNEPTGGWRQLTPESAKAVSVPGTVEEYMTRSSMPQPGDNAGVSWWFRQIRIPENAGDKRVIIHFESVRLRAEVYLDGRLVAYDVIGESPFDADITEAVKFGKSQQLAVRVTNPGGNFHWQDFTEIRWGEYHIPPGRGFGGIIGRVWIDAVEPTFISDVYMQNQPDMTSAKAIISLTNTLGKSVNRKIAVSVAEKSNPDKKVWQKVYGKTKLAPGDNQFVGEINLPDAKLWDLDNPNLYVCTVELLDGKRASDCVKQTFGFRWFEVGGKGEDAVLRLNGRRVMLRSAISWGYWPATGLHASPEMARKQVLTAKSLGLNMLNFHRSIGSPVVLEAADQLGLLYYEEPGAFHSAGHDPFIRAMVNTKLRRMVKRDRSHPSLVIYNLINEFGGVKAADKALVTKRMNDMRLAHAVDPSRIMTFTSGWASKETAEEDSKANMMPFDTTLYRKGWFDNHRAGGPATWEDEYYRSPSDNLMFTNNRTEVYMRGEEGAISTPPRIAEINREIAESGKPGWDGLFWKNQYEAFDNYFNAKGLAPYFGTLDSLTRTMGDVQLDHQGRRIQGMRMQDIGDAYVINGWESMPYDNHSGVVDNYRNVKGNLSTLSRYTRPLYVAVAPRTQFTVPDGKVGVDLYIVNEKNLSGQYTLAVSVKSPDGETVAERRKNVAISGGERFGELLWENCELPFGKVAGLYDVEARLLDDSDVTVADGCDQVLAVDWRKEQLAGRGAIYGQPGNAFAQFYEKTTGRELPEYADDMGKLDWVVVSRSSLDAPQLVESRYFKSLLKVSYYSDNDISALAGTGTDEVIDRTFVSGAQPDKSLAANQSFSIIWTGTLVAPADGVYMIGAKASDGVRLTVKGDRVIDEWNNQNDISLAFPFSLKAGEEVAIEVQYRQRKPSGNVSLVWSRPDNAMISPDSFLKRVHADGTTLLLLESAESWMDVVAERSGIGYDGYYAVGRNWIGGIHFVKSHPLFKELPVNCAMAWAFQDLVRDGDRRLGFKTNGDELVVGSYRSMPFHLGSAVGVIPYGRGKIVYSTLDISRNLNSKTSSSDVVRKLFCNMIETATQWSNENK